MFRKDLWGGGPFFKGLRERERERKGFGFFYIFRYLQRRDKRKSPTQQSLSDVLLAPGESVWGAEAALFFFFFPGQEGFGCD